MQKILFLLPLILALLVSGTVEAKKKKYPNGDYYEGEWKKGQPDGFGKMIYANGNIYEGNWILGVFNGFGKMTYNNGDIYEGKWNNNLLNGLCKIIYSNGNVYEGELKNGIKKGFGKIIYSEDCVYEGQWDNDYFIGKYNNNDKLAFSGTISNNFNSFFSGKCSTNFDNIVLNFEGDIYSNREINGNRAMKGKIIYSNGSISFATYNGQINNFKREGTGEIVFNTYNNITINGKWEDDYLIEGKGYCTFDKEKYYFSMCQTDSLYKINIEDTQKKFNKQYQCKFIPQNLSSFPNHFTLICSEIHRTKKKYEQQEQENLKQKQIALEKAKKQAEIERIEKDYKSFNIASHIWTTSDIRRLYEENPLKCRNIVGSAPIILVGRIVDITLNRIYLQNDIILTDFDKDDKDVINLQKGQLIYAFTDIKKVEYGSLIFESPRITGNQMHLWTVIKPNLNGLKPSITRYDDENQKYVFEHLVKNIYR